MGLKPWDFWRLTPREWELQVEAHHALQERLDYRAALICSTVANVVLKPAEMFVPEDFMPRIEDDDEPMCEQDQVAAVKSLAIALGAEIDSENGGEPHG